MMLAHAENGASTAEHQTSMKAAALSRTTVQNKLLFRIYQQLFLLTHLASMQMKRGSKAVRKISYVEVTIL